MNPVLIKIGSLEIMWYSVLILLGAILGIVLLIKEGKKFNYDKDFIFNMAFWTIIFGFLGARIYYVIFNFSIYQDDFLSIFKIWEGGLAIHGGIIAGLITIVVYCKKYSTNYIKLLDMVVPSVLIAQAIGRWGNFFNSEAHGPVTTIENLQSFLIPEFIIDGMFINGNYYHPTFFYESLWCLLGFIIVILIRKLKYIKCGQIIAFYLMWYSVGRFLIESLRTDSLMFAGVKVAQMISILLFLTGLIITIILLRKSKFENLYNAEEGVTKL